jgi:hypothetical protein
MEETKDLSKQSKISFPKGLNQKQVERFFEYLSHNSLEVNYQVQTRGTMSDSVKHKYPFRIDGRIVDLSTKGKSYDSSFFNCPQESMGELEEKVEDIDDIKEKGLFYGLEFSDKGKVSEKEVQLWEKVDILAQKYFPSE